MTLRPGARLALVFALGCQSGNTGTLDLTLPEPGSGGTQATSNVATPASAGEPTREGAPCDASTPAATDPAATAAAGALAAAAGASTTGGGASGTAGGTPATGGGVPATAGAPANGGVPAAAGAPANGGVPASAGAPANGGAPSVAGAPTVTPCNCDDSKVCVDGACLDECSSGNDCTSGSRSQCLLPSGGCVECLGNATCIDGDRPLCGPAHECVECLVDLDCLDPQKPSCVQSEGRCR